MTTLRNVVSLCLAAAITFATRAQTPPVADVGLLPGDATADLAARSQQDHSIARGTDAYLIAWTETRAGGIGNGTNESDIDVFAMRLDFDGNPISPGPILISAAGGVQQ